MLVYNSNFVNIHHTLKKKGSGLVNKLINKLPFELHIPSYNFCGPGTKLNKRLGRGDKGINPLDEACKEHDIAYAQYTDIERRHEADKVLAKKALQRVKSADAKLGERAAALSVAGAMKVKTKLGMGIRRLSRKRYRKGRGIGMRRGKQRRHRKGKGLTLSAAIRRAHKGIVGKKHTNLKKVAQLALASINKSGMPILQPKQRIIPVPKTGGFLPLIPLFAGLSALGALGGGAAGIAKAVNDAKAAKEKLEEEKRHNKAMEQKVIGKGLYLRPYKTGFGLYLKPYTKNSR